MGYAMVVKKLMENVRNGNNQMDAQFINVLGSIMFSSAVCVMNFLVNG
jgi:hypothetical protein